MKGIYGMSTVGGNIASMQQVIGKGMKTDGIHSTRMKGDNGKSTGEMLQVCRRLFIGRSTV